MFAVIIRFHYSPNMSQENDPGEFSLPPQPPPLSDKAKARNWKHELNKWGPRVVFGVFLLTSLPTFRIVAYEFEYGIDLGSIISAILQIMFSPVPFTAILALIVILVLKSITQTTDRSIHRPSTLPPNSSAIPPPPGSPVLQPSSPKAQSDTKDVQRLAMLLIIVVGGVLLAFSPLLLFIIESPSENESSFFLPLGMIITLPVGGVIVVIGVVIGFLRGLKNK